MNENRKRAGEILKENAELYEKRNAVYGDNYIRFGKVMAAIFEDGLELKTEEDFMRYGTMGAIVGKLCRYANNFSKGGHEDSLNDVQVYAAIMQELDLEINNATK